MAVLRSGYFCKSVLISDVFLSTSNVCAHFSYSAPVGSLAKLSVEVCITWSCASNLEAWITRLP